MLCVCILHIIKVTYIYNYTNSRERAEEENYLLKPNNNKRREKREEVDLIEEERRKERRRKKKKERKKKKKIEIEIPFSSSTSLCLYTEREERAGHAYLIEEMKKRKR